MYIVFCKLLNSYYTIDGMYACQQCHKKYTYTRGVKQHIKYECNKDKQFQCNICSKRYTRNYLEPEISIKPLKARKLMKLNYINIKKESRSQPAGKKYTFEEKAAILQELTSKSVEVICKQFGIHKRSLSKWIAEQDNIEKHACDAAIKNLKKHRVNLLDDAVFNWYLEARSRGMNVTGSMIRKKALSVNAEFGGNPTFSASEGWLTRWKERHHIRQLNLVASSIGANLTEDVKEETPQDEKFDSVSLVAVKRPPAVRNRTVMSEYQLHILKEAFKLHQFPDIATKNNLSRMTGLPYNFITVWFQRRRHNSKHNKVAKSEYSLFSLRYYRVSKNPKQFFRFKLDKEYLPFFGPPVNPAQIVATEMTLRPRTAKAEKVPPLELLKPPKIESKSTLEASSLPLFTQDMLLMRNRTVLTDEQSKVLCEFYKTNPFPDNDDKQKLEQMTGLTKKVISVWFQNRRQRHKKR
nr:unnamed protein product [Callosobruchus chinensis]